MVAGSGLATLDGGTGNNLFVINNVSDVINAPQYFFIGAPPSFPGMDTLQSSVSYSLPTDVDTLVLTGTGTLVGTGNNYEVDTLVAAGTGTVTLVGGTGSNLFEVDKTSDVVNASASEGGDTIQSSVNYVLPTNTEVLTLTGTAALAGTGNSLADVIVGNTGKDTLTGGSGVAVIEGGSAGSSVLKAPGNQAALIAGGGASTLTGGAYKDFYAAGAVSDSITTGATANVVAFNKGDGATTLTPTTGASDVLSLGAGIDTESLTFTKSGTNLILNDSVSGDSVTFSNWYSSTNDQNVTTLQVVEIASAEYNASGTDPLRNQPLEDFNFSALVAAFNSAARLGLVCIQRYVRSEVDEQRHSGLWRRPGVLRRAEWQSDRGSCVVRAIDPDKQRLRNWDPDYRLVGHGQRSGCRSAGRCDGLASDPARGFRERHAVWLVERGCQQPSTH